MAKPPLMTANEYQRLSKRLDLNSRDSKEAICFLNEIIKHDLQITREEFVRHVK